jgi:conjugative transfer pilus assembly protein TraH
VEDFIGDDPSTASTGVDVFVCDTTTDCLNPTVPAIKVSITPFVKKVSTSIDALRTGITTRAMQNINDFRIVDASSVPVWKLLTTATATNQPQIVDLYKRLIAVDIAYSYFNGLIRMASQSLANAESGAVPPDAQTAIAQLHTRLSNLSALVQTMRIAEYTKTSGEANLQRQIQLMHQAMVAGIPAQAFTSMTVFGSER